MNYELYNRTTIRPFKGDELMLRPFKDDEYCDENHYRDPTSLIEIKLF